MFGGRIVGMLKESFSKALPRRDLASYPTMSLGVF
jgi:hypothetical protein